MSTPVDQHQPHIVEHFKTEWGDSAARMSVRIAIIELPNGEYEVRSVGTIKEQNLDGTYAERQRTHVSISKRFKDLAAAQTKARIRNYLQRQESSVNIALFDRPGDSAQRVDSVKKQHQPPKKPNNSPGSRVRQTKPEKQQPARDQPIIPEQATVPLPTDNQPIPEAAPDRRAAATDPKGNHRTEGNSSASDIADAFDKQRDEAKRGIAIWHKQLDEMVQDSGSFWSVLGATAAATALSVTEFSMDQASGLLGVTRLGQGVAKGSFSGVMEDVDRLVSVLPQGRVVKVLSIATDVYAVGNTVASGGDLKTIAVTAAGALIGGKSKKRSGQRRKRGSTLRVQAARTLSKATRAKYLKRVQELHKALDLRGQSGKTTAILIARDPKTGALKTLLSSSMERVPKKVRDKMKHNEFEVRGTKKSKNSSPNDHSHHAEVNGLSAILSMSWEVVEIFPSRNACPLCAQMRKSLGVRITNPK